MAKNIDNLSSHPMNDKELEKYREFKFNCEKFGINFKDPAAKEKLRKKQLKHNCRQFGIMTSHVLFKLFLVGIAVIATEVDNLAFAVALMLTMLALIDLYGAHRYDWFPSDFDTKYVKRSKKTFKEKE
jgi:hypothetical protein